MTEVMFHFNVADKVDYACRLLRKAHAHGARVGVLAELEALHALDTALWSFAPLAFIPHCLADAPAPLRDATPIVLASRCSELADSSLLVHLGQALPQGFERFERLIELVGSDTADRTHARLRWRHYAERGYAIASHDAARPQEPHAD
ncbi:MAG TPA: DNA polymerase III subunit chi [Ottowia sp.]|uniref:DNA polymerase III subunit chi n=1 Tax=Ottowia sp. TaxID=1898956 RepID=UPI002BA1BDCC|nr:DNA polymerase III subunit chi [Ottowia sp.]HMN20508.1 DNA polymerase III subunit chi [Ottowia sp.]